MSRNGTRNNHVRQQYPEAKAPNNGGYAAPIARYRHHETKLV